MTIDDYKAQVALHDKAIVKGMVGSLSVMFVSLGAAGLVRYYDDGIADLVAPVIIFLVGFPLMLYGFTRVDRTYRRFPTLICPHCEGTLARPKATVIATGNCPSCGRRVLADATIGT